MSYMEAANLTRIVSIESVRISRIQRNNNRNASARQTDINVIILTMSKSSTSIKIFCWIKFNCSSIGNLSPCNAIIQINRKAVFKNQFILRISKRILLYQVRRTHTLKISVFRNSSNRGIINAISPKFQSHFSVSYSIFASRASISASLNPRRIFLQAGFSTSS